MDISLQKIWKLTVLLICCFSRTGFSSETPLIEPRLDEILQKMTLEEKVAMCVGGGPIEFMGVPRLNLPNMVCTDGPRGPHMQTAFPVGVAFGATWNPAMIEQAAVVMGKETRADGAAMLLGPGLNILRDPLGGRFFEYFSEDPLLTAELTVGYVKGLQSQKVAACLKHYVCNNREDNRNNYMSIVSRRALNEIYFPAFRAGVERGHAWALMTSANGVNDEFVSDSKLLLNDTLKKKWGFDGMVMTDWLGTRSTEKAAFAGLDVSMPYRANSGFGRPLLDAVKKGEIPEAVVDDKARRVLRTMARVGLLDGVAPQCGGIRGTKEHFEFSRRVAEESIVLLKNESHTLPLDSNRIKKILVVGPNADQRFCLRGLGGSSWQEPPYEVTALQGVKNFVGPRTEVQFISTDELGGFDVIPTEAMQEQGNLRGFLATYFKAGEQTAAVERMEPNVNFLWEMRSPDEEKIPPEQFSAQFSGWIIPPISGTYALRVTVGAGSVSVFAAHPIGGAPLMTADSSTGRPTALCNVQMEEGKPFYVRLDYAKTGGDAACRLEWALPTDDQRRTRALAQLAAFAKAADAVLVFAGIDHGLDSEGRDRTDMSFPEMQREIIHTVAMANPKTVVTLINGSPLELGGWLDEVPAVVEAWYGGMDAGTAIADVLFGKINPSGKLPFTWPKKLADSPSYAVGKQNSTHVYYLEGIFTGYRYYDTMNVEPMFPFGHGLSYTKFEYENLTVEKSENKNCPVTATVTVKNTGAVAGKETVQIYSSDVECSVEQPGQELAGFAKVELKPGESRVIDIPLSWMAFQFFDEKSDSWVFEPGEFIIRAGGSSRALPLQKNVDL